MLYFSLYMRIALKSYSLVNNANKIHIPLYLE